MFFWGAPLAEHSRSVIQNKIEMQELARNIPVFILAGGLGSRIMEESHLRPKPMIEIGNLPILIHLMRYYYSFGFDDFVICAGYRSWEIKNYFLSYEFRANDVELDHRKDPGAAPISLTQSPHQEKWRVRVVDTGEDCMTGGRVARALDRIDPEGKIENFALTYGDGLSDVNLQEELVFHLEHSRMATVLGVNPVARFGELDVDGEGFVRRFHEKPENSQAFINGGFLFLKRHAREYLSTDSACILEREPLSRLAADGQLKMLRHKGFWHPMDTLRDRQYLQGLWDSGRPPWVRGKGA